MSHSSANRVEKFGNDRKGRNEVKSKTDNRKRNKTQRGNNHWEEQDSNAKGR